MDRTMNERQTDDHPLPSLRRIAAIPAILAALYVPQSWYFLMDYPWSSYRLHWLRFFPGLPVFCPVAMVFHPSELGMAAGIWVTTALIGVALYVLSRKSRLAFWSALTIVCVWSLISGIVAHSLFRA
jgi:hypothetical protein